MKGFTQKQIYRPASFASFKYSEFKIGNLKFYVPNHHLAYDTPHPSISPYSVKKYYEAGIFPQKYQRTYKMVSFGKTIARRKRRIEKLSLNFDTSYVIRVLMLQKSRNSQLATRTFH